MLVLEARQRVGGACTLEEVWPGFRVSPCAYLVGLLHPLVIEELDLAGRGFEWVPAERGDVRAVRRRDEPSARRGRRQCEEEIRKLAPGDLAGWRALNDVKRRLRDALRPPARATSGSAPRRLASGSKGGSGATTRPASCSSSGRWSSTSSATSTTSESRWRYLGQGVIGTNASPHDPGTASIHFHHASGRLGGARDVGLRGGRDGDGLVPALRRRPRGRRGRRHRGPGRPDLARRGGRAGRRRANRAPVVVSNADPKVTLRLLGDSADPGWRARSNRCRSPAARSS